MLEFLENFQSFLLLGKKRSVRQRIEEYFLKLLKRYFSVFIRIKFIKTDLYFIILHFGCDYFDKFAKLVKIKSALFVLVKVIEYLLYIDAVSLDDFL